MELGKVYMYILKRRNTPAGRLLFSEGLGLKWGSGINCALGLGFRDITKGSSMVEWEKAMNVCFQEGMFIPLFTYGSSGFCPWKLRLLPMYCYRIFLPIICTCIADETHFHVFWKWGSLLGIDTDYFRPGCGNRKVTEPHAGDTYTII